MELLRLYYTPDFFFEEYVLYLTLTGEKQFLLPDAFTKGFLDLV